MRLPGLIALYFAIVFGAGFAMGAVREMVIKPRVGLRTAELMEMPVMLVVVVLASRFIARRARSSRSYRLGVGCGAAAMVLGADLVLGVTMRGMTPAQVWFDRDPLTGALYYALVALMAILPACWPSDASTADRGG